MVYSPAGGSDLILILGCMTPKFFVPEIFITLYSSSLWRTDTIVFSKSSKPPSKLRPPPAGFVDGPLTEGEGGDFKQHIAVFIGISESAVARGDPWGGERRRPEGVPKGGSKQSLKLKKRRVTRSVLNIYIFFFQFKIITKFDYAFEAMHAMFLVIEIALSWI